jgi:hypothetical protein
MFIRVIYENCPLIECLSLIFPSSKEHFVEFETLLNRCQNLTSLLIIIKNIDNVENDEEIGKELLEIINRSTPREIKFVDDFNVSL